MYDVHFILFPWDCSSIGQSTALSRRKLRVRAPSVPTDPNPIPIKKYICICCEKENTQQNLIPKWDTLYLLFYLFISIYLFISFTFLIKEIWKFPFIQLVPIDRRKTYVDQYNYWQNHIQDSKRYRTESGFFDYSRSV